MIIPKQFKMLGHTITVGYDPELSYVQSANGHARFVDNRIALQPNTEGVMRTESQIEETFVHEVLHHALMFQQYEELASNEDFVARIASILHQAFTTAEGKLTKSNE